MLAIGWNAMVKRGIFPLPPVGRKRIDRLRQQPCGAMHFVSASDLDAGYYYTMGAALSPEAQALGTMDVSFGLDGELIVPGQAVSPIPPFVPWRRDCSPPRSRPAPTSPRKCNRFPCGTIPTPRLTTTWSRGGAASIGRRRNPRMVIN